MGREGHLVSDGLHVYGVKPGKSENGCPDRDTWEWVWEFCVFMASLGYTNE